MTQQLVDMVNTQHQLGFDQSGNAGGPFFAVGNAADPAGTVAVDATLAANPGLVAASAVGSAATPSGSNNADNADAISQVLRGTRPAGALPAVDLGDQYQRLVTGLGSTVSGINTQAANQQLLATQVDDEREQQAGVSLDEETVNLMQAQRAYEASSRVLSVMNSILDTLINRTGV
jgi:flagellar hook-associated protein 1 FlgK